MCEIFLLATHVVTQYFDARTIKYYAIVNKQIFQYKDCWWCYEFVKSNSGSFTIAASKLRRSDMVTLKLIKVLKVKTTIQFAVVVCSQGSSDLTFAVSQPTWFKTCTKLRRFVLLPTTIQFSVPYCKVETIGFRINNDTICILFGSDYVADICIFQALLSWLVRTAAKFKTIVMLSQALFDLLLLPLIELDS